jgi:glyoxylase-like metal-dependent hydrolase (beta-lactamase superfamily II)
MKDIVTIDCNYVMPKVAAAYLLRAGDKACFIDNNTNYAVPALLAALKENNYKPEDVSHIIITHVHLDHAGATGLLLSHCPHAIVVAHPRAAPHVINPTRLVESARSVYGAENFHKLYGEILPVPESRVYIPADGEIMQVGDRELEFIYTRGHANHHFVILDKKSKSIFTGDSFGIAYPLLQHGSRPFLFPSTSPTDFDAAEARISYNKIVATGAERAYPTHFDTWSDMKGGHAMLMAAMYEIEGLFNELAAGDLAGEAAYRFAFAGFKKFFDRELSARGIHLAKAEEDILGMDIDLNAQGLAFAAQRARKKGVKTN